MKKKAVVDADMSPVIHCVCHHPGTEHSGCQVPMKDDY